MNLEQKVETLRRQGVEIPTPHSLEISDDVPLEQIQGPGTVLHAGTRLRGAGLSLGPGCIIGREAPVTLEGCALGQDVRLAGGYFAGAVMLDRVALGSGAHVRTGTLMEEESNAAHTVGLKQTVLLPFVTLGSLINFCDVLMSGGTSRRDHSEVGSSFIHFNFTPFGKSGDKATPSLVGDVPRGVMLRSPRIFLGGQAGLVGPLFIDYGTVLAAGFVYRRDQGPDRLVVGEKLSPLSMPFSPLRYNRIQDKVRRNLRYIGNLVALWHWYASVRKPLARGEARLTALYDRAMDLLAGGVAERVKRLGQIAGYMEDSIPLLEKGSKTGREVADQRYFLTGWAGLERRLGTYQELAEVTPEQRAQLTVGLDRAADMAGGEYITTIRALPKEAVAAGSTWLNALVDEVVNMMPWPENS